MEGIAVAVFGVDAGGEGSGAVEDDLHHRTVEEDAHLMGGRGARHVIGIIEAYGMRNSNMNKSVTA